MIGYGLLNPDGSPTPALMDAIRYSETGHLPMNQAVNAVSSANAIGPYQLLAKNLNAGMGYGVSKGLSADDARDPTKSRNIATQYVSGINQHHGFNNPIHSLVAYNWGPANAARWIQQGAKFDELPNETKQYVARAIGYTRKQQGSDNMTEEEYQELLRRQAAMGLMPQDYVQPTAGAATPQPMLAMPSEDDATVNIDGTPVNKNAILNQVMQAAKGALSAGPNAQPMADRPISDEQSRINAGQSMQGRPNQQYVNPIDMQASYDTEALAQRDASPNLGDDQGSRASDVNALLKIQQGALSSQNVSGKKRDNATMMPQSSALTSSDFIRLGAATYSGALKGDGIGAFGKEFGAIEDAKNRNAIDLYKASLKANKGGKAGNNNAALVSSGIVTGLIDEVIPVIEDDANGLFNKIFGVGGNTTGMFGQLLSKVGGTDANNLRAQLATIRSNIGFDKLQSMREASPTGGALGNVSEKENEYLQSVLGNVEQSQNPEQLKRNLLRLREAYLDIVHGYGNRPTGGPSYQQQSSGGSLSPDVMNLMNEYAS